MDAFKIIGSGAIVRRFVECFASDYPDVAFAIYARGAAFDFPDAENVQVLSIKDFAVDARPTFVCCSVNEEDILRKSKGDRSRNIVAGANVKLLRSLIERGIFNHGLYFVLTNPSEVIGQCIADQTGNPSVYSLGLSVDQLRYRKLLTQRNVDANADFRLAGNHWNRSFPIFRARDSYSRRELDTLYEQYNCEVQKEFDGFKPPVQSGAEAINHLVKAFIEQTSIQLSGSMSAKGNFVGGAFYTKKLQFTPTVPADQEGINLYQEILGHHESLMAEVGS
jgi:hypothetical protein